MKPAGAEFLSTLTTFESFQETTLFDRYRAVPAEWSVFISDVVNSTEATASGRYKEVNLIGASCIISVLNAVGEDALLYVFGGDGATFVTPPEGAAEVEKALRATRSLAQSEFGLRLRIAHIPVSELYARGHTLGAARWRMGRTQTQSLLCGSAVPAADTLAKSAEGVAYLVPDGGSPTVASYEGLECRWNPIPSERGEIMSLLVESVHGGSQSVYSDVVREVERIYGEGKKQNPAKDNTLKISRFPFRYWGETRIRRESFAGRIVYLLATFVLTTLWDWFRTATTRRYRDEVVAQSDYRKFDGMLRMILDGTASQHDRLAEWLEERQAQGLLYYGTHRSQSALLTCLIFDRWQGRHLHLVDGNDGGYTLAARSLKERKNPGNGAKAATGS